MKQRITIECLESGQRRAYGDHYYHYRVTFEFFRSWLGMDEDPRSRWEPATAWDTDDGERFKAFARGAYPDRFPDDEPKNWASIQLTSLKMISPGVWEWTATRAYTG